MVVHHSIACNTVTHHIVFILNTKQPIPRSFLFGEKCCKRVVKCDYFEALHIEYMCIPSNLDTDPNLGSVGECRQRKCPWLSTISCDYYLISWRYEYVSSEIKMRPHFWEFEVLGSLKALFTGPESYVPSRLRSIRAIFVVKSLGVGLFTSHGSQVFKF